MSTITAILEADADGTLHLPVPENLRRGKVKVVATLETAAATPGAKPETPLGALKELRKLGGLMHVIPDPVAWQREQRKERIPPGRD
jgi:DNA mismatch repair protein MutH